MTRVRERHPWNTDFEWSLPDRERYIVQYCHSDAVAHARGESGPVGAPTPQTDPRRQFEVVRGGDLVPSL